jgi:hypothetical protein
MPLLKEIFEINSREAITTAKWSTAFIDEPVRLQALQKGSRWELLNKGTLITEN